MTPGRWSKLEELYHAARDLAPQERSAFLATACRGDEELQRQIEAMLAQDSSGRILDGPAAEFLKSICPGDRLGHYEIVSLLGAGGMGEVYRARDPRLGRDVALKILSASTAGNADRRARFEREARAVAALNHPNIVAIHDVGTEDGVFFIVSELVEG